MQRLFSTFANGWPGLGLLIQRFVTGIALLHNGVVILNGAPAVSQALGGIGAVLGLFILLGLWTPLTGALISILELWIAFSTQGDSSTPLVLATLGGTISMIGPGAWSIDARLFGRKHIAG